MSVRVVNLKGKVPQTNIRENKTYNVLVMVRNIPSTRSRMERTLPNCWRTIKNCIDKKYIIKFSDSKYRITEKGLDRIDLIEIEYGVYQG